MKAARLAQIRNAVGRVNESRVTMPAIPRPTAEELATDPCIGLRRTSQQFRDAETELLARINDALSLLGYSQREGGFFAADDTLEVDIRRGGSSIDGRLVNIYTATLKSGATAGAMADDRAAGARKFEQFIRRIDA